MYTTLGVFDEAPTKSGVFRLRKNVLSDLVHMTLSPSTLSQDGKTNNLKVFGSMKTKNSQNRPWFPLSEGGELQF